MASTVTTAAPKTAAFAKARRSAADLRSASAPRAMTADTDFGARFFAAAPLSGVSWPSTSSDDASAGASVAAAGGEACASVRWCFFALASSLSKGSSSPASPSSCGGPGASPREAPPTVAHFGAILKTRKLASPTEIRYEDPKRPHSSPTASMRMPTRRDPAPHDALPQKRCRPHASPPDLASARTMASATGDAADVMLRKQRSAATVDQWTVAPP
mmetsp:Transcript_8913/g.29450  ORF Transcript_8913/g.29450 Transcript_8913/m.29450 type:complete len:216 (-) Transcript_8913:495-1142(-)